MKSAVQPTQEQKTQDPLLDDLRDIQPASERTRSIPVVERVVAINEAKLEQEVSKNTVVFVRPLTTMRWLRAMECVGDIVANLPVGNHDLNNDEQLGLWLMSLLGSPVTRDAIVSVACMAIDKEPEFFDRIDLDEGLKVFVAVVEVSKDFFVLKVLPLVSELLPKVKEVAGSTFGQTQ